MRTIADGAQWKMTAGDIRDVGVFAKFIGRMGNFTLAVWTRDIYADQCVDAWLNTQILRGAILTSQEEGRTRRPSHK